MNSKTLERIQVWSCGGGVQSAAIAAMLCIGHLDAPDIAVIVDTEREMSTTWEYFDAVLYPNCLERGIKIHRVNKSDYATVDLYSGADKSTLTIPAFTDHAGRIGKLPTYCSNEWKVRALQRFCIEKFPESKGFDQWLGISRDESHRMRFQQGKWQYKHPLIDDGRLMSRTDCIQIVRSLGWPEPPKSRCYMCPNQTQPEWEDMRENHPEDFLKAQDFESRIRVKDNSIYLHSSGKRLDQMITEEQLDFGGTCMSGMCFT